MAQLQEKWRGQKGDEVIREITETDVPAFLDPHAQQDPCWKVTAPMYTCT